MTKNLKIGLIILVVLVGLYLVNLMIQNKYNSSSEDLFSGNIDDIYKISIEKVDDLLELSLGSTSWEIIGNDSLVVKQQQLDNLFNKVLSVKKGTIISENPEKWNKYSVDDSTGTHLSLFNARGNLIAHYVFGRSKSDYSRNYVRVTDDPNVYLTDQNIIYYLQTREMYWGEKPKPVEVEPDTTEQEETSTAEE